MSDVPSDEATLAASLTSSEQPSAAATEQTLSLLDELLEELREHPGREDEIVARIEETFGEDKAVWVLDMSGFSRTVQERGIVLFLLMIHKMRRLALPVVRANDGLLVKAEADNLLCLFPTVEAAIRCSHDVFQRLEAANAILPSYSQLYAAVGIGFGHILHITDEDVFGDEINLTHKIGEDIAQAGEVLLTASAREQLAEDNYEIEDRKASISGLEFLYFALGRV